VKLGTFDLLKKNVIILMQDRAREIM